jgi:hypothetical protein
VPSLPPEYAQTVGSLDFHFVAPCLHAIHTIVSSYSSTHSAARRSNLCTCHTSTFPPRAAVLGFVRHAPPSTPNFSLSPCPRFCLRSNRHKLRDKLPHLVSSSAATPQLARFEIALMLRMLGKGLIPGFACTTLRSKTDGELKIA